MRVLLLRFAAAGDDGDKHKAAMAKWGIREEGEKKKAKSSKKKTSKVAKASAKETSPAGPDSGGLSAKDFEHLFDETDLSEEVMAKRVQMVVEKRGRRGVNKMEQTRILKRLAELAETVSPQCHLEVMGHLISAEFDTTSGGYLCMGPHLWTETFKGVCQVLEILTAHPGSHLVPLVADVDGAPPERAERVSVGILASFVERLDEELMKALQFTDVHSDAYKERLGKSADMLVLLWRVFCFLDVRGFKDVAATIALKVNEHMHYRSVSGCVPGVFCFLRVRLGRVCKIERAGCTCLQAGRHGFQDVGSSSQETSRRRLRRTALPHALALNLR